MSADAPRFYRGAFLNMNGKKEALKWALTGLCRIPDDNLRYNMNNLICLGGIGHTIQQQSG